MSDLHCGIPCFACGASLKNFESDGNHPLGGLEFKTGGHYGSALFDRQAGLLAINVCDPCLRRASEAGRVLNYMPPPRDVRRGTYQQWPASADTLPEGGDAKQAPCASKGSAVPNGETPKPSRDTRKEGP